ncbi:hypothetical protein [Lacrimispora saccharolytica]|uniref:hypothetical protein n=1 Tax=Lacrimispora saccharolytica TaxID=84030 RepID=UPI00030ACE09|nr:hypothetical protein [Lacrimispora saccharolytica]QRV18192.1 hypothetical protein I6K70_11515 [Lacrimispora saccharolytica]
MRKGPASSSYEPEARPRPMNQKIKNNRKYASTASRQISPANRYFMNRKPFIHR